MHEKDPEQLTTHPELAAEQAVIDRAYARLDDMRNQARAVAADVMDQGQGGTHSARFERDVRVEVTERRLAALREADAGLVFGRIDRTDGERLYVGRVAISDEHNEPLIVDWRAPAAEAFYRATPGEPLGLTRRRHFMLRGRRLVNVEDDLLSADGDNDGDLVLVGEAALLHSLRRARSGRMGDIVATIQREQDEIIRAPLPGVLVVQGGPGTGKTAVALHRAAYLLYTYRFPLERAGVLLIGPNRVFLRYIEAVLPSLGEHTVTFATPATLLPAVTVTGTDSPQAARVKGDARMATVLANAVRQRQRALPRPATIPLGAHLLTLTPEQTRQVVRRVKRRHGTHNERRAAFERQITRILIDDWRRREGVDPEEPLPDDFERQLHRERAYVAAVERTWPILTPAALLHDLFGVPALLKLAAHRVLADHEWQALVRPRQRRLADVAWTDNDVALLDEAARHLGRVPSRARPAAVGGDDERSLFERAVEDAGALDPKMRADLLDHLARWTLEPASEEEPDLATRTFGHVIVDEAQDLSPMQARMVGRRVPSGSMTIVGDLGQASGESAARTWEDVTIHVPGRERGRVVELSVNYRTPAEVMDLAARLLEATTPGLNPPRSVRSTGERPVFTAASAADMVGAAATAARDEMALVGTGRVAVIAPLDLVDALRAALGLAGPDDEAMAKGGRPGLRGPNVTAGLRGPNVTAGLRGPNVTAGLRGPNVTATLLDQPIAVYPVEGVKGLEFDGVVVVEPAAIVGERRNGLRALYVALTRTTRRLHVVHHRALPAPLVAGSGPSGGVS